MRIPIMCIVLILVCSTCFAEVKFIFEPQEGVYLAYSEKDKQFQKEPTKYSYTYEIVIDSSSNSCRIAAIEKRGTYSSPIIFHNGSILKQLADMIVLSKNPVDSDPYQEFYFIYPKLGIGFMVIGKANDGFTSPLVPTFPSASISTIPLRLVNSIP